MKLFRKIALVCKFMGVYFWELCESNFVVAFDVLVPKDYYHPGLIVVPVDLSSEYQAVFLANLITMSPGSICVDYRSETKELTIHLMYLSQQEKIIARIQQVYVPIIKELLP